MNLILYVFRKQTLEFTQNGCLFSDFVLMLYAVLYTFTIIKQQHTIVPKRYIFTKVVCFCKHQHNCTNHPKNFGPKKFGVSPHKFGVNPRNFGVNPPDFGVSPHNFGVNPQNLEVVSHIVKLLQMLFFC